MLLSFIFRYDYVQILEGSTELARGCGTNSPGLVMSSGNIMVVKFRSDEALVHRGFNAFYTTGT